MPTVQQTAHPTLKSEITQDSLDEGFQVTTADKRFVSRHCRSKSAAHLGMMVQLKVAQCLGRFLPYAKIPSPVIKHIKAQLGSTIKLGQLKNYFKLSTKDKHVKFIRKHLKLSPYNTAAAEQVQAWAIEAAKTKESVADIINVTLERLIRGCIELPGFRELERTCESARHSVNTAYYKEIAQHLKQEGLDAIDRLLVSTKNSKKFWSTLKIESKKPTPGNIKHYLAHLEWLKSLQFIIPEELSLPPAKYDQFINEAMALDQSEMMALRHDKRIALCVVLIRHQYARTLDDAATIIIKTLKKIDNLARQRLENHLAEHRNQTDKLVEVLQDIISVYINKDHDEIRLDQIIGSNPDKLLSMCQAYLKYSNKNHLPFMLPLYRNHRATLFRAMSILSIEATTKDKDVLNALAFIRTHQKTKAEWLPIIDEDGKTLVSTRWIRTKWWTPVTGKHTTKSRVTEVHKDYFELCVFERIAEELNNGDIYVNGADEFNDYRKNYISQLEYNDGLGEYCEESGLPTNGRELVSVLRRLLSEQCEASDANIEQNETAQIVNGKLVLTPAKGIEKSKEAIALTKEIKNRMEKYSLLDIIIDAEKWLKLSKHFGPMSGNEGKLDDPMMRFVLTVFCYGTNIGPTETARSMRGVSRKQAARLNLKYVNEKRLDKANAIVANAYKKFGLIKHWGDGSSASADGKLLATYEDNLRTEFHIRHGSFGGIAYYHVSDTYIALFSHFIPCGVYEAIYILDGLLKNDSDFNPDTLHGDTQAQSTPVFGLAYLLGIKLMPRIRNIKDLRFYKPTPKTKFNNLSPLFKESIDWNLIERHYDDMMQIAMSIKAGKMTASTILRRFGTKNRKNKVYFAFRELGRVVRTLFLLEYITDQNMRKTINAATCKSEEFNEFSSWIFFANKGKITANNKAQQSKIMKYNQLLANIAALHNVNAMTKIFNDLKKEGYPLTDELMAGCSPYHTDHYGRLGSFDPDLNRKVVPLKYGLFA
jgi:TnpA family transposase